MDCISLEEEFQGFGGTICKHFKWKRDGLCLFWDAPFLRTQAHKEKTLLNHKGGVQTGPQIQDALSRAPPPSVSGALEDFLTKLKRFLATKLGPELQGQMDL